MLCTGYVLYGFEEMAQWHAESNTSLSLHLKRWRSSNSIYLVFTQYRIVSPYHCDKGIEVGPPQSLLSSTMIRYIFPFINFQESFQTFINFCFRLIVVTILLSLLTVSLLLCSLYFLMDFPSVISILSIHQTQTGMILHLPSHIVLLMSSLQQEDL